MRREICLFILLFGFISAFMFCKNKEKTEVPATIPTLTGWIDEAELFDSIPSLNEEKENYQPDSMAVQQLKNVAFRLNILTILGTWCPDSRREVPRFLKVMDEVDNENFQFQLLAVDRSKRDSSGIAEKYEIEYVPTFVVIHNDQEIGRIIETPMETIEQDLVDIVANYEPEK